LPNTKLFPPNTFASAGQLEVNVTVDEQGKVTAARIATPNNKMNSVLIGSALIAAKQWIFEPATLRGKRIASEHTIVFQFRSAP
jgi:TonB family protein